MSAQKTIRGGLAFAPASLFLPCATEAGFPTCLRVGLWKRTLYFSACQA
jgi:hypothetical protein